MAKALGDQGWTVWWDPKIRTGTPFDRSIEKALKDARSVLVVWSHHSVDSDWVRAEATDGLSREILISVAIEPNVTPPIRFLNIHTEHLTDWDGKRPSPSFDKIVADLKAILKGQEPPKDTKVPEFEPPRPPQKPTETTGAPAHEVDENLEEEIRQYRQKADSLHATLPVAGFVTHLKVPIDIEEIYVPLHALLVGANRTSITNKRSWGATPCDDPRDRQDSDLSRGMNLRWLLKRVAGHFGVDTESLYCSAMRSKENG